MAIVGEVARSHDTVMLTPLISKFTVLGADGELTVIGESTNRVIFHFAFGHELEEGDILAEDGCNTSPVMALLSISPGQSGEPRRGCSSNPVRHYPTRRPSPASGRPRISAAGPRRRARRRSR
jgi:hypothetical protein